MNHTEGASPPPPIPPADHKNAPTKPDAGGPLPLPPEGIPPSYPVHYGPTTVATIKELLRRIHDYLEAHTPARVINRRTGAEIVDVNRIDPDADLEKCAFRLICYEWGVICSGMLFASEVTSDPRFRDYAVRRLQLIAKWAPYFQKLVAANPRLGRDQLAFFPVIHPANLDDAGSLCTAMIKAHREGVGGRLRPCIDNYIGYICAKQFRLEDGTLARQRPLANSLWLDDLYMSVPALAQMGHLTGKRHYFDEAVKQVTQFAARMFNRRKGLYMHGWVAGLDVHPEYLWGRANGWALMAKTELLELLPIDHPGRASILDLLRAQIRGLAENQSGDGLWHQLLDRDDSYLETSASAIFVYGIARAINRGWIDVLAHGPMVQLGWNAVAAKVNPQGQVEGTCVGSGMAFDPAFYYYRPTSVFAAHGYGPTLLAGAEMINLAKSDRAVIHDGALHFGPHLAP